MKIGDWGVVDVLLFVLHVDNWDWCFVNLTILVWISCIQGLECLRFGEGYMSPFVHLRAPTAREAYTSCLSWLLDGEQQLVTIT